MPLFPRSHGGAEDETLSESADQVRGEAEMPLTRVDTSPKKTAAVVQAVVAEEQRQMEMVFVGQSPEIDQAKVPDDKQIRSVLDDLGKLEKALNPRTGEGLLDR